MFFCVPAFVAAAAYVAADQADPKVVGAVTNAAEGGFTTAKWWVCGVIRVCAGAGRGGEC